MNVSITIPVIHLVQCLFPDEKANHPGCWSVHGSSFLWITLQWPPHWQQTLQLQWQLIQVREQNNLLCSGLGGSTYHVERLKLLLWVGLKGPGRQAKASGLLVPGLQDIRWKGPKALGSGLRGKRQVREAERDGKIIQRNIEGRGGWNWSSRFVERKIWSPQSAQNWQNEASKDSRFW